MGYSAENGYVPVGIDEIMASIRENVNTQFGTTYTAETFVGTNMYKYFYALAQRVEANEIKTSEIFLKLQDYFDFTNETILSPKVTPPGFLEAMADAGYIVSVVDYRSRRGQGLHLREYRRRGRRLRGEKARDLRFDSRLHRSWCCKHGN